MVAARSPTPPGPSAGCAGGIAARAGERPTRHPSNPPARGPNQRLSCMRGSTVRTQPAEPVALHSRFALAGDDAEATPWLQENAGSPHLATHLSPHLSRYLAT